jgi:nucleoid DNA-binding protein
MTLTKADLVEQLIGQSGLDRTDAKQLVNQMFEEIGVNPTNALTGAKRI